MNGLTTIHLELTSRCNKTCAMCGRRKLEQMGKTDWGDMDYGLVEQLAQQVPPGIVIQFHNSGEPLLYPKLGDALALFKNQIRSFNTNGKLLLEKAGEIIGNVETLVVSVVQDDPEAVDQYDKVIRFLARKGDKKPFMIYRLLGNVPRTSWDDFPGVVATRTLHDPMGSFKYQTPRVVPEIGLCLDLLTHMAVDRHGNVSYCVRLDPDGEARIGHVNDGLGAVWKGSNRMRVLNAHIAGKRNTIEFCNRCHYWGIPG